MRSRWGFRALRSIAAVLAGLATASCDSPTGGDTLHPISPDLKRIMYWGNVSPTQDEPNRGDPTGNVFGPLWHAPDRILINSARRESGDVVRGIFEVEVDAASLTLKHVRTFAFPYLIRNFDYDTATGVLLVTFSRDASNIQTVRCVASEPSLTVVDTLIHESWFPLRARFTECGEAVIAYAVDPATSIAGFYVYSGGGAADSLFLPLTLGIQDALGFDAGAGKLVYGVTSGSLGAHTSQLYVVEIGSSEPPRLVTGLPKAFVSAGIDPSGSFAIVCTFDRYDEPPGALVYNVDLGSGGKVGVELRTHHTGGVIADFASWSPSDRRFVFSAGGFSSEGDVYPRELWAKVVVPQP